MFQKIYANGYYIEWSQYSATLLKKDVGLEKETIEEIINFCIDINIFDKKMYSKFNILTSRGIQKRYFLDCKRRKDIEIESDYLMIDPKEYGINVTTKNSNETETPLERG